MKEFTDTELANEQWRDIEGYDGMYQVSDIGRVRSKKSGEWKIKIGNKDNDGYLHTGLSKDGKRTTYTVHRLVANAFIPNDDESKTIINRINECKSDNRAVNLVWCDRSYNCTYNDIQFRKKNSKRPKIKELYRPDLTNKENIAIFNEQGIKVSEWTVTQLRKDLKINGSRLQPVRRIIRHIYDPELSINDNLKVFKEQGIECSIATLYRLRKELGLSKQIE